MALAFRIVVNRKKVVTTAPAWAVDGVVHKYLDCAHFLLVGRRSERLCRRLVIDKNVAAYFFL